jgi:hypothetical protein
MDPRLRDSLVWGAVGGLAFLVLIQGYELWAGRGVDALVKVGVAALVAVVAGGLNRALRRRLPERTEES